MRNAILTISSAAKTATSGKFGAGVGTTDIPTLIKFAKEVGEPLMTQVNAELARLRGGSK